MKNPFVKRDNTKLIAAILAGSVLAGAAAYLFLTDSGTSVRGSVKKKLKEKGKDLAADLASKKTGFSKKTLKKVANHLVK
ncbi:MAG: hypothetical protein EOP46_03385 [Sphingobacteriaceae bacterium]|nr:MAG: hypothetical protein EOP46_03385 [Sphingobacteriaceae bacterium]